MAAFSSCFSCNEVSPRRDEKATTCPLCGSAKGEVLSAERVALGGAGLFALVCALRNYFVGVK
jgi:hypothetical protein